MNMSIFCRSHIAVELNAIIISITFVVVECLGYRSHIVVESQCGYRLTEDQSKHLDFVHKGNKFNEKQR